MAALAAGCAAIGVALALVLPGGQARAVHVHLAAWSVDTNGNDTVTVTVRQLTRAAQLQRALAEAGVPAVVTFREECLNTQNQNALTRAGVRLRVSVHPPGEIITPSEIRSGTKLLSASSPWSTARR
jgi:shikimate 5-dehydrogenase